MFTVAYLLTVSAPATLICGRQPLLSCPPTASDFCQLLKINKTDFKKIIKQEIENQKFKIIKNHKRNNCLIKSLFKPHSHEEGGVMLLYPTAGHPRLPSCSFSRWSETQLRTLFCPHWRISLPGNHGILALLGPTWKERRSCSEIHLQASFNSIAQHFSRLSYLLQRRKTCTSCQGFEIKTNMEINLSINK